MQPPVCAHCGTGLDAGSAACPACGNLPAVADGGSRYVFLGIIAGMFTGIIAVLLYVLALSAFPMQLGAFVVSLFMTALCAAAFISGIMLAARRKPFLSSLLMAAALIPVFPAGACTLMSLPVGGSH